MKAPRRLPDLTPPQVVALQDALLANADELLMSALAVLDRGNVALARSLAILGLEESGKAIGVHDRRVAMSHLPEGETFRCVELDELWSKHQRKLETVHGFLVREQYAFGVAEPDRHGTAEALGAIRSWASKQDRSKQRGFYVDLGRDGTVLSPKDVADEGALREVIARVHQIGWQLRLGEHIEGKRQDKQEAGVAPATEESVAWLRQADWSERAGEKAQELMDDVVESLLRGSTGSPINNAAYRFNPPGADRSPFASFGRPGYEAETRELLRLMDDLDEPETPSEEDE